MIVEQLIERVENRMWRLSQDLLRGRVENHVWDEVEDQIEGHVWHSVEGQLRGRVRDEILLLPFWGSR